MEPEVDDQERSGSAESRRQFWCVRCAFLCSLCSVETDSHRLVCGAQRKCWKIRVWVWCAKPCVTAAL